MKANNTTIENALYLAFSPEYVNALSLVELAETWNDNHNARDLELNIAAYAEQCTYKMEQEGKTLEFDAWERLTAEIERIARVWVSLYCNEISWSNRPEWIANSVRAALNTTTTPETPNPDNTPSTMNANETTEFSELTHAGQCLDIYLMNTSNIYERYTLAAIEAAANAKRVDEAAPARLDDATAWDNLTFWVSWQPVVKNALKAAARLVKRHDHLTPTAQDIEQVTRNYAAYIVDCAKYEIAK